MRNIMFIYVLASLFIFSGCSSKGGPASLLSYSSTISTEEINEAFVKAFPINKKSSFGSVSLKRAALFPSTMDDKVKLSVSFGLTSFEIPEGISGMMSVSAGLRYDPKTKKIFLKNVTPEAIQFGNASLSEYVSKGARTALNVIVMKEMSDIEIYQMKEGFTARFIKNISVKKGDIIVNYGL